MWVFDLDGTLVDTREAVRRAYAAVGVKMPRGAWGRPWREWLTDEAAHRAKNAVYPEFLHQYARPLPLLAVARRLDAPVITGASAEAANAVAARFGSLNIAATGLDAAAKREWLASSGLVGGTYVDDQPFAAPQHWRCLPPPLATADLALRPWVVMPAAGASERFAAKGYATPKPLLLVRSGRGVVAPMAAHSLGAAPRGMRQLLALPGGGDGLHGDNRVVMKVADSRSQVETVRRAISTLPPEAAVLTLDCDCVMRRSDLSQLVRHVLSGDYAVAVAVENDGGSDPNKSRVDQIPHPAVFAEKGYQSPWGVVGARAFSSAGQLLRVMAANPGETSLSRLAAAYPGRKVAHVVSGWSDWGTPERLHAAGARIVCGSE